MTWLAEASRICFRFRCPSSRMNAGYPPSGWMRNRGTLNTTGGLWLPLDKRRGSRHPAHAGWLYRPEDDAAAAAAVPHVGAVRQLAEALRAAGYGVMIERSENLRRAAAAAASSRRSFTSSATQA
jgi:hypothetical protein